MQKLAYGLYALISLFIATSAQATVPIWQDISGIKARGGIPTESRQFRADASALRQALRQAPHETSLDRSQRIKLPLPDGSLKTYVIVESPIMEDRLAARYPEIKTYQVFDPINMHPRGRLSMTPRGFHGMVRTPLGQVYIDPQNPSAGGNVYLARQRSAIAKKPFRCEMHTYQEHRQMSNWLGASMRTASRVPGSLLEYRIAVAANLEYFQGQGGTKSAVTSAIATTINRVNDVYETDLGIRLKLVDDNDRLYEEFDQGLPNSASALLPEVDAWIDSRLPGGDGAYDLGHMFFQTLTTGGGLAFLGGVCDSSSKGGGVTGLFDPSGDAFNIDYVAHEIGHQFNAEHSFNGTTGGSCGTGRWAPSAWEPGSGSTIMAYAGLCGDENLQQNTTPSFHAGSIEEINSFTASDGACFALRSTSPSNNDDPEIPAIANEHIPANTPFILDVSSSVTDPDTADADLTFQWDQMDVGCPTDFNSFGTDTGSNPLFRSSLPRDDGESWRNFPALGTQLRGRYDKAEVLPCQDRDLNFKLTARDGSSGIDYEDVRLTVVNTAGPFEITNLKSAQDVDPSMQLNVTWDVADTDLDPINCDRVEIDLLTFSDAAYTRYSIHSLSPNTGNDGTAAVTLPADAQHPRARIRVKCRNNVFYALSEGNLNLTGGTPLDANDFRTRNAINSSLVSNTAPSCPVAEVCEAFSVNTSSSSGGGSAIGLWLLLGLGALPLIGRLRRYGLQ